MKCVRFCKKWIKLYNSDDDAEDYICVSGYINQIYRLLTAVVVVMGGGTGTI
jgi:hypothetical protein